MLSSTISLNVFLSPHHLKVAAPSFKPENYMQTRLVPNASANQMSVKIASVPDCVFKLFMPTG